MSSPVAAAAPALVPLQGPALGSPLGRLLVAILVLLVVVLVGRVVLAVAWRLLALAAVVVGVLYALSFLAV